MRKDQIIGKVALALFLLCLVGGSYYLWFAPRKLTVWFEDGKGLSPGANVLLAGTDIGDVTDVRLVGKKVRVRMVIDKEMFPQLNQSTAFYISSESLVNKKMRLEVLVPEPNAPRLVSGDEVQGTDSWLDWQAIKLRRRLGQVSNSEKVEAFTAKLNQFASDLQAQFAKVDWNALGSDMQRQFEDMMRKIENSFDSEQTQETISATQNHVDSFLQKLEALGESEEARELEAALRRFIERLTE